MLTNPWFFILGCMARQRMGNGNRNTLRLQTGYPGQGASIQSRVGDGFYRLFTVTLHKQKGFAETVDIPRGMKLLQFSLKPNQTTRHGSLVVKGGLAASFCQEQLKKELSPRDEETTKKRFHFPLSFDGRSPPSLEGPGATHAPSKISHPEREPGVDVQV